MIIIIMSILYFLLLIQPHYLHNILIAIYIFFQLQIILETLPLCIHCLFLQFLSYQDTSK